MSQTTINLRTENRQSTLMLSGFISTLLGVVVNMWWTGRAESAICSLGRRLWYSRVSSFWLYHGEQMDWGSGRI